MSDTSIVEYLSSHEGYKCGYCKSENTCYSHGMWADSLTPLDYQNLIDRGWRRSGKYVYKPTLDRTCCPQYTIRCEAKKFMLSKSQKKVLKKVHKFLASGEKERYVSSEFAKSAQAMEESDVHEAMDVQILQDMKDISKISRADTDIIDSPNHTSSNALLMQDWVVVPPPSPAKSESSHANICTASTKSNAEKPCRKAKELRRERKLQKLLNKGVPADVALSSVQKKGCEVKTVEDFINEPFTSEQHKLELRLVPSSLDPMLETFEESYSVYKKYQMAIHKDPPEKCVKDQFIRFLVRNPFKLRLVPTNFRLDEFRFTFDESYKVYQKYQMKIHNDKEEECDQDSYRDFLVETPFKRSDAVSSQNSIYGSFHHQYWLDGKLIAVGVIDILPYCVSSVYFYYDPDYSHLSLGTYAALREIALTRELNKKYPNLQYYYMGFYIHSCVKMRYKGQYNPSYLLCPETYIFKPIEKCLPKLEISKYHRLEEDPNKEDCEGVVNLSEVLVLYNRRRYSYQSYLKVKKNADDEELAEEEVRALQKKIQQIENDLDQVQESLAQANNKLEEKDKALANAEGEVAALNRRIQLIEEDLERSEERLKTATAKLEEACHSADESERMRKMLEHRNVSDEDRMEQLEDQLKEARQMAEEADRKYDEVARKMAMVEADLERAEERAETGETKIVELEEELRVVGNNLKSLEVSEEKNQQREEAYEAQIRTSTSRLKEALQKEETYEMTIRQMTQRLQEAEARAEFAERSVQKLQKEVDRLEDELVQEKEKYKAISDELDQTFAELTGY